MSESAAREELLKARQPDDYYRWAEPDSDITVCLNLGVADRLQREVLGRLASGPRRAAEVRGILLGTKGRAKGRTLVVVDDFEPVAGDDAAFEAALAGMPKTAHPVGYFRSHNRDGMFLSPEDLKLIESRFREPDNLFLVVKPLINNACTAGFFFWKEGRLQTKFTDSEVPLIPVSGYGAEQIRPLREISDISEAAAEAATPAPRRKARLLIFALPAACAALALTLVAVRQGWIAPRMNSAPPVITLAPEPPAPGAPAPAENLIAPEHQSRPSPQPSQQISRPAEREVDASPSIPKPSQPVSVTPPPTQEPAATAIADAGPAPAEQGPRIVPAPIQAVTSPSLANPALANPASGNPASLENPASSGKPAGAAPEPPRIQPAIRPPTPRPSTPRPSATVPPPVETRTFTPPRVIHKVTPAVPRGIGPMITTDVQVDVAVDIDKFGKVTGTHIAGTQGVAAGLLTIEAQKAAQLFRFEPAQENGQGVPASLVLNFRFAGTAK